MNRKTDARLAKLRERIDAVDRKLLALLSERGALAKEVGERKRKLGLTFHAPAREREVLARMVDGNPGPYPDEAIEAIFREVMSASLALESPLTVAVADDEAREAARRRFGSAARLRDEAGSAEVVDAVERGWAAYGVLAVEDGERGFRGEAIDAILDSGASVTGEILSTADGATVRSLVIGGEEPAPAGDDQTSALLVPRDEPGAIARVLAAFGKRGVNVRRIEARPLRASRSRWTYQFFVDLEGHRQDAPLAKALADLAQGGAVVRVLGSYPRAGAPLGKPATRRRAERSR